MGAIIRAAHAEDGVLAGWDTYFERLGPQGIRLTFAGLLDGPTVAGLTGEAALDGIGPAERAQIVADLVGVDPDQAPAILLAMDAEATRLGPAQSDDDNVTSDRLGEWLRHPDMGAAPLLHQLARAPKPGIPVAELRAAAELIATTVLGEDLGSRPKYMAKVASDRAGLRELEQERRELESRVRQLETQLARTQERAEALDGRLARLTTERQDQRLTEREAREERGRLERELSRLQRRIEELNERRAREGTGEITTALRRLAAEQRRIGAGIDKLRNRESKDRETFREITRRLTSLSELVETLVQQHEASSRAAAAAQEAILRQLGAIAQAVAAESEAVPTDVTRPRRTRPEGQPRVALFVDVQNMFYGAREKGAKLDFEALLAMSSEDRQLVRAVAYLVETREIDQSAFIHLLEMKAYEVKRKPLRIRPDRTMKGNWDLEIAIDALRTAPNVDVVVLVTGDGDFVPLVRQLKMMGKRVEVIGFTKSSAPDLREAADRFFPVTRRLLRPIAADRRSRPPQRSASGDTAPAVETAEPDEPPTASDGELVKSAQPVAHE